MDAGLLESLKRNPGHEAVTRHPFFGAVRERSLTREEVTIFLAQYWYPIEFFTTHLASLIAKLPTDGPLRTVVSRLLWQELGEGSYDRAHLYLYLKTMTDAGFAGADIVGAPALDATVRLVDGYRASCGHYLDALGWLYGTEVIDLTICTGLGRAVKNVSGKRELPWLTIHAEQEPDHVVIASAAMGEHASIAHSDLEATRIRAAAEECWRCWRDFFTAMHEQIGRGARSGDARA
jgi:pyrroloquinoline quinone (PQQ) biosynthesis protein C